MASNKRKATVGKPTKKKNFFQRVPLPYWIGGGALLVAMIVVLCILVPKKNAESSRQGEYQPNQMYSLGLVAVKQDGKWGYRNEAGQMEIAFLYEDVKPFRENGMAAVKKDGKWGYINDRGQQVIPCIYQDAESFSHGLAPVEIGGKWGYINSSGMDVVPAKYEFAGVFAENGLALIRSSGLYGYLNAEGVEVIAPGYDSAGNFNASGMALVSKQGAYGYIDKTGAEVIPFVYDYLGPFASGLAPAKQGGLFGFIDETGNFAIQPQYDYAEAFSDDGVAKVMVAGKYSYINTRNEMILREYFQQSGNFYNGYAVVKKDGKQGLLKTDGTYAIPLGEYQFPKMVSGELLVYKDQNGLYGYMDVTGKVRIAAQFTAAESFRSDGYAAVAKDGKWGLVKSDGTVAVEPLYEDIK